MGNVRSLYIYIEALRGYNLSSGWKRVEYVYDRISGKVDSVVYQRGKADQWLQAYRYDGLNRLVEVWSSRSGWPTSWRRDAHYRYYLHGPLGRMELGHWPVQGLDYLYTLNGWIKGLNSYSLSDTLDVSRDGNPNWRNPRRWVPKDILAYEVLYYPGDYQPIGGYDGMSGFRNFVGLYNGNIGMSHIHQDTLSLLSRRYRYDALQRLRSVEVLEGLSFTPTPAYGERFTYDRDGNITSVVRYSSRGVMDSLRYHYYTPVRNWLSHVTDTVGAGAYSEDLDSQAPGNYRYDETGNLIEDISEGIQIHWTHYGKVWGIDSAGTPKLRFLYDASGNRVVKEYVPGRRKEIYVRDAQGNVLAVYEAVGESLFTKEYYLYGVQRLGYLMDRRYLGRRCSRLPCLIGPPVPVQRVLGLPPGVGRPSVVADSVVELVRGSRRYELSDWLGNVRVVVTDARVPVRQGGQLRGYRAEVVSVGDYYSYGGRMMERSYEVGRAYRWGFNGQEVVGDVSGNGNTYDFGARLYDGRVGRWLSPDPQVYRQPGWSAYKYGLDNPIIYYDPDGETEFYYGGRWIGTDGRDNGMIGIVRDRKLARQIERSYRKGRALPVEVNVSGAAAKIGEKMLVIHRDVLRYSYAMLEKSLTAEGEVGEYTNVLRRLEEGGRVRYVPVEEEPRYYRGDAAQLPEIGVNEVGVSIHSHPTGLIGLGLIPYDALELSEEDKEAFKRFEANIVVGKTRVYGYEGSFSLDSPSNMFERVRYRKDVIALFDERSELMGVVFKSEAKGILEDMSKRRSSEDIQRKD